MTKKFNELFNKMSPKVQKSVIEKSKKILSEMPLRELRQAHQLSQERIAVILSTKQANISRLEQRTDMYISTLRSYIDTMKSRSREIDRAQKNVALKEKACATMLGNLK